MNNYHQIIKVFVLYCLCSAVVMVYCLL